MCATILARAVTDKLDMIRRTVTTKTKTRPDPRTVQLALDLLERTAGRRRRCRRCDAIIAENAGKLGTAWSICTPCVRTIEADTRQIEIAPPLVRVCLVCLKDIEHRRPTARTCGAPCRSLLARILAGPGTAVADAGVEPVGHDLYR